MNSNRVRFSSKTTLSALRPAQLGLQACSKRHRVIQLNFYRKPWAAPGLVAAYATAPHRLRDTDNGFKSNTLPQQPRGLLKAPS
ncbi:hypothetical protein EVAR_38484_1 [Eumeta japonica]|uniref:Uncharacterized protein n=1 Tax=Eumeta variegata TaxID=151549 RepID=A0A4C1WQG8_EUMVA|nr:hypothetical protein EVAR_38484_1 [Eumeta japonica]